jgi:antirestriction protein
MTKTNEKRRVWIGCLACYNGGRLVGQWFDADEAEDITPEIIHACDLDVVLSTHEELWVFDHEGFGGWLSGECSPIDAANADRGLTAFEDSSRAPLVAINAWLDNQGITPNELDDTHIDAFQDAYQGEYESPANYAREMFHDTHGASDTDRVHSEWPYTCIDWERAAEKLIVGGNIWVAEHVGGVSVFWNH